VVVQPPYLPDSASLAPDEASSLSSSASVSSLTEQEPDEDEWVLLARRRRGISSARVEGHFSCLSKLVEMRPSFLFEPNRWRYVLAVSPPILLKIG